MRILIAGLLAACLGVAGASAQTYGSANLAPGFQPDPHTVQVVAGGNIDARQLGGNCVGMIADPADYAISWGGGSVLTIGVVSQSDTTLVIVGPGNRVGCDDDSGGNLNPAFRLENPEAGVYQIWVGTLAPQTAPAVLFFTEQ